MISFAFFYRKKNQKQLVKNKEKLKKEKIRNLQLVETMNSVSGLIKTEPKNNHLWLYQNVHKNTEKAGNGLIQEKNMNVL